MLTCEPIGGSACATLFCAQDLTFGVFCVVRTVRFKPGRSVHWRVSTLNRCELCANPHVHSLRICTAHLFWPARLPFVACGSKPRPKGRVFELKWLFFLDLSVVDRRLHDDLRKICLHS